MIFAPGDVIAERYRVTQVLGKGGFGTTYAAVALADGSQVAVKHIALDGLDEWKSSIWAGGGEVEEAQERLKAALELHPKSARTPASRGRRSSARTSGAPSTTRKGSPPRSLSATNRWRSDRRSMRT